MNKLPMPFEKWTTYPGHSGVDFPQPKGTPILASGNGTVTQISDSVTGGWRVWVKYDTGTIKYCHMDTRDNILVSLGEKVVYEQPIAKVGKLGNAQGNIPASTGYHLHIENADKAGFEAVWEIVDKNEWVKTTSTIEDSDMRVYRLNGKDYFMAGVKRLRHLGTMADVVSANNVFGPTIMNDRDTRIAFIGLGINVNDAKPGADKWY